MNCKWKHFLLIFSLFLSGSIEANSEEKELSLVVTSTIPAEIQLQVKSIGLSQVLDEIRIKTGVSIHYSNLPVDEVSATCTANKIEVIFRCLLEQRVNFVFHYSSRKAKENGFFPTDIWLLGRSVASQTDLNQDEKPVSDIKELRKLGAAAKQEGQDLLVGEELEKPYAETEQEELFETLFAKAKTGNAFQRGQAIFKLASTVPKNDNLVTDLLADSLIDESPHVRAEALAAWVEREEDGYEDVLQSSIQDDAVEVRMKAVGWATTQELLLNALGDSETVVQKFAKKRLELF